MESQANCPYCGEPVVLDVDLSGGRDQTYEEDCPVCCRTWIVHAVEEEPGGFAVAVARQDD